LARTTTLAEAGSEIFFETVAVHVRRIDEPPNAVESRLITPANDGETLMDSASTTVEAAAVANGVTDTVTVTAVAMAATPTHPETLRDRNMATPSEQGPNGCVRPLA
jgi:hypothetical protein